MADCPRRRSAATRAGQRDIPTPYRPWPFPRATRTGPFSSEVPLIAVPPRVPVRLMSPTMSVFPLPSRAVPVTVGLPPLPVMKAELGEGAVTTAAVGTASCVAVRAAPVHGGPDVQPVREVTAVTPVLAQETRVMLQWISVMNFPAREGSLGPSHPILSKR